MKDFKIEVKSQEESKEAQELLFELGYRWFNGQGTTCIDMIPRFNYLTAYICDKRLAQGETGDADKEITLPQLRDKVVLHRNDVRDANAKDDTHHILYLSGDGVVYSFHEFNEKWVESKINGNDVFMSKVEKIEESNVENLISGKEALIALANGEELEYANSSLGCIRTNWLPVHPYQWSVSDIKSQASENNGGECRFRLKPRTIKIGDVDVPTPFNPKEDCIVYIIDDGKTDHYKEYSFEVAGDCDFNFIGMWRTESEIKQVVAALRKLMGVAK